MIIHHRTAKHRGSYGKQEPKLNPNRNGLARIPPSTRDALAGRHTLGDYRMNVFKLFFVVVFLIGAAVAAPPAHAQSTATNCTASQQSAVSCFVANAVTTDLTTPRYGMTLAQFQSYGFAVSQILQTHQTYVVLVAISSAIADALPPTNADGTSNQAAQDAAVAAAVNQSTWWGFATPPQGATVADLEHFSMDVARAMNGSNGVLELFTPGVSLRIIDSYIVTATSNGKTNLTELHASLSAAISNFVGSGLMKDPPGLTLAQVDSFANSLAWDISTYKAATHRTTLSAN